MRRATAEIAHAVVDLGTLPLQLHTYFDSVERQGSGHHLVLSPIAASALPRREHGPVRVHCVDGSARWTLVCPSITPISENAARVDLANARILPPEPTTRRSLPRNKQLALVTPVGIRDSDANVFPIVELDAETCVLDATTAFELGQYLPMIEIVGDRHVLRRCAASVFQITPWCTPEGSRRFRCLLRLSENEPGLADGLLETVDDPMRVRRVMEFAVMSGTLGWYEAPDGSRGEARFFDAGRDALGLAVYPALEARMTARQLIKVGFSLFSVTYEMSVRTLDNTPTELRTALPLTLRRGRSYRKEQATAELTQDLSVRFMNPVTGSHAEYPVTQLSMHKLTCELSSTAEMVWEGLPLEDAQLLGADREIPLGELRVTSIAAQGRNRRVELTIANPEQHDELTEFVAGSVHADVSIHDGHNFRGMVSIYKEAGLFGPHMRDNLDPILPQAKRAWHLMHQSETDLVHTWIHGSAESPDAAASLIRPWERAWLAQHMVSVSQQFNGAAGQLQLAILDHVQRRPDGQYLMYFVKTDNRQMNAFHERFRSTSGTDEAIERRSLQFWKAPGHSEPSQLETDEVRVSAMRSNHEQVVGRAAERLFGVHGAAALSLVPGDFQIPDTEERYRKFGLTRSRVCSVVSTARSLPLWAVVEEISSQGMNLTWMLNASWLFPVHGAQDKGHAGLRAALQHILRKPKQTPTGDVFVNSAGELDADTMQEAGFEKLADVYIYTLNRAGINRYFYYTCDRYGEIDVRTQQRMARRSGIRLQNGVSLTSLAPKRTA